MINLSDAIMFVVGSPLFTKSVRDFIDYPTRKRAQKQNTDRRIKYRLPKFVPEIEAEVDIKRLANNCDRKPSKAKED